MTETGVDHFLARTGLIATRRYQEFAPAPDLARFVACTWVSLVRLDAREKTDAVLPDGCADIMVWNDQPPIVAGPDAVTRWATLQDGLVIVGIRLRPGACRAVLRCPAERIVNGGALLSDFDPRAAVLHQRLLLSENLASRIARLEDWARTALERASDKDRAVIAACKMLGLSPSGDVADVARRLDWNPRTIHRHFLAACGYGPKHFHRIMRVQAALRAAHDAALSNLGEVAAAAGYADQAHMTRDFRAITGFTPASYLAERADPRWGVWISAGW